MNGEARAFAGRPDDHPPGCAAQPPRPEGARYGCGAEQCGACAVLIDGEDKPSCARRGRHPRGQGDHHASRAWGRRSGRIRCRPAFLEKQAGQCGYCLSGILVGAKALLDRNPDPSRAEIADALAWHLCRCGAHNRIMAAVALAAERMRDGVAGMIPPSLAANPRLDRWVGFETAGRVRIAVGKVEYGQGTLTGLAQIAAEELDVALERLDRGQPGDRPLARRGPDGGLDEHRDLRRLDPRRLRRGAGAVRRPRRPAAGLRRGRARVDDGAFLRGRRSHRPRLLDAGRPTSISPRRRAARRARRRPTGTGWSGRAQPRLDLPAKVFGAAFLHDLALPGMLHARVLRQPGPQAQARRRSTRRRSACRAAAPSRHPARGPVRRLRLRERAPRPPRRSAAAERDRGAGTARATLRRRSPRPRR